MALRLFIGGLGMAALGYLCWRLTGDTGGTALGFGLGIFGATLAATGLVAESVAILRGKRRSPPK